MGEYDFMKSLKQLVLASGLASGSSIIWFIASFLDNDSVFVFCMILVILLQLTQMAKMVQLRKFSIYKDGDERDLALMYKSYHLSSYSFVSILGFVGIGFIIASLWVSYRPSIKQVGLILLLIYNLYFFTTNISFYKKQKSEEEI